jgi:hypothetical protein
MPKFILDLQWTSDGLKNVSNGTFREIRTEAIDFVTRHSLTIIQIIDRIRPTPIGPIWIVEGEESNVKDVVLRFNGFGNVTAQYFDYIDNEAELDRITHDLFEVRPRS